jgi:hypothetical protein
MRRVIRYVQGWRRLKAVGQANHSSEQIQACSRVMDKYRVFVHHTIFEGWDKNGTIAGIVPFLTAM